MEIHQYWTVPRHKQRDDHPILHKEVEAAIQSMKKRKSAGVDNIPAELVRAGEEDVITTLTTICNKIWQKEERPTPWTQSLVITLPKKGNLQQCQNCQTISLISHPSKVMLKSILNRLKSQAEKIITEERAGFRAGRSTTEQILSLCILCEKYLQHQQDLYHVFIDFKKAFDRVWHAALWATMKKYNISTNLIQVIKNLYNKATSAVLFNSSIGDWFRTTVGVWQECLLIHPLQHISGKDHNRRLRRSQWHCQHWRQNNHQPLPCWWHWWLSIIIIINPLTARVVGAPQMILQPIFSIFPCSPLPSGTCWTPGLSSPWCCLPTSSFVHLVFFPLSLCPARWFWPDLMNGRHDHTTAVCIFFTIVRRSSCGPIACWILAWTSLLVTATCLTWRGVGSARLYFAQDSSCDDNTQPDHTWLVTARVNKDHAFRWLSRRGRKSGKFRWASWQSLHSLRHGDMCQEDQADDKHQWHQHRDQSEWTEAWDSHKLQIPGLNYNWWGFQAWDTLQDSTDNSSIVKAETSLNWQEYFSQLQDTTDVLPFHIHLPVCLWIMDPHSRAPKNTSHGNEVLPQDTKHLIQRPCYQQGSPCQDPAGNWTTQKSSDDRKEMQIAVVWSCFPFIRSGQTKPSCKAQWKGEEGKADRGSGEKTTSGNGQAWSSTGPRGQWRTGKNLENWLQNHLWCPNDPRGLGIDDNDDDDDDDDGLKQKSLQKKKLLIYTKDFFWHVQTFPDGKLSSVFQAYQIQIDADTK